MTDGLRDLPMRRRAMRPRRSSLLWLVLTSPGLIAALVIACSDATAPLPTGAIAWNPPARFALWWQMTESCSGRQSDLRAIRWYVVPNATSIDFEGEQVQGVTLGTDRIVLADAFKMDGSLVRHEMLHALLRVGGHPRDAFLVRCDGVVACVTTCETDAGGRPTPAPSAPEISPHDVATRIEVVPRQPSASRDDGAVAVIVSITNPRSTSAWVRLTPQAPGDQVSNTFGVAFDYDDDQRDFSWSYDWTEETRFPLGPNETRRWVFDAILHQGRYGVRGRFNSDTTQRLVVSVSP
jgi:hypothetical protein